MKNKISDIFSFYIIFHQISHPGSYKLPNYNTKYYCPLKRLNISLGETSLSSLALAFITSTNN
nr:MAG TPA: protein of unknown function (DUF2115) [Caudoviricetes sp.]